MNKIEDSGDTGTPITKSSITGLADHDIADVKAHVGAPLAVGSGMSIGDDIFLSSPGGSCLPHEAHHVVQQKQGRAS